MEAFQSNKVLCDWLVSIPDDDDDEIEQVPSVAQVGTLVHEQSVGYDLHETLHCEDDEKHVLYYFLKHNP